MIRFPKVCLKCGQLTHYSDECTRIPNLGKSQQEREFDAMIRQDRAAVLLGALFFVLALVLVGMLERV